MSDCCNIKSLQTTIKVSNDNSQIKISVWREMDLPLLSASRSILAERCSLLSSFDIDVKAFLCELLSQKCLMPYGGNINGGIAKSHNTMCRTVILKLDVHLQRSGEAMCENFIYFIRQWLTVL